MDTLFNEREARIAAIITTDFGVEAFKVTREAELMKDLKADSLDIVELVLSLEDDFKVEISDDEAEKLTTVADVFAVVDLALAHEADASIRPVA